MDTVLRLCSFIPFYLIGAFPTGYLIGLSRGIDIRQAGSGNVGATNVGRILGKQAGLVTLVVDCLKGYLPLPLALWLTGNIALVSWYGAALVAGHCFSLPPRLKGGKGVATALGVFLYLQPHAALAGVGVFALVLFIWRIVSLSSVVAAAVVPLFALLSNLPEYITFPMAATALIVIFRHRGNLTRLAQGREERFSFGRKDGGAN
jgi:acyl phosphate:glycerol-3-phosphate acyltransferase